MPLTALCTVLSSHTTLKPYPHQPQSPPVPALTPKEACLWANSFTGWEAAASLVRGGASKKTFEKTSWRVLCFFADDTSTLLCSLFFNQAPAVQLLFERELHKATAKAWLFLWTVHIFYGFYWLEFLAWFFMDCLWVYKQLATLVNVIIGLTYLLNPNI